MKQTYASEGKVSRRDRIRQLGFDPNHLTSTEQQELIEIEARLSRARDRAVPAALASPG